MIRFEKVSKWYGNIQTLTNISFEVKKGEMVSLIGPSGCGKTTTLRMINRLIDVSSGGIFIDGKDISTIDPVELRRSIGYVIQQVGLLPHLTIGKNIGLVPKLKGWKEEQYSQRIDDLLYMVGLDPKIYRNRYPTELSGGQQQRIGVIRALAAEPPIVLMDEPFSALDPVSREQLQDDIARIQKEIHKTIVFVTHDMDEALKISDRIAIMNQGHIVQLDTPKQILENPINEFVKGFIGEKRLKPINKPTNLNFSVENVMTPLSFHIAPHHTISDAWALAKDNELDVLMIFDERKNPLGVVTFDELTHHINFLKGDETIFNLTKHQVSVLEGECYWKEAVKLLANSQQKAVAVMRHGVVIGLVTEKSIVKNLANFETILN